MATINSFLEDSMTELLDIKGGQPRRRADWRQAGPLVRIGHLHGRRRLDVADLRPRELPRGRLRP
jgi:hypothetical protein